MEQRNATNLMLNQLEKLSNKTVDIQPLLLRVTAKLNKLLERENPPSKALENLRNNILQIMQFTTAKEQPEIAAFKLRTLHKLCTGALLYFIDEGQKVEQYLPGAIHADNLWITDFVVQQIAAETKQQMVREPQLSEKLKKEAELKLFDLASNIPKNLKVHLENATKKVQKLKQFESIKFISSLIENTKFLLQIISTTIQKPDYNDKEYSFRIAIGAIRYLNERNDLIPDSNGIIGFLDDSFVLEMASQLIKKHINS